MVSQAQTLLIIIIGPEGIMGVFHKGRGYRGQLWLRFIQNKISKAILYFPKHFKHKFRSQKNNLRIVVQISFTPTPPPPATLAR